MQSLINFLANLDSIEYAIGLAFLAGFSVGAVIILGGWAVVEGLSRLLSRSADFGWRPAVSYLLGKRNKNRKVNSQ